MDVLVSPLKVMDDSLVCELLFYDKNVLEKVNDPLFDVKMIKFCYHSLLVLQVLFICVDQGIPFVNHTSNVVKYRCISASLEQSQSILKSLIFFLFSSKLIVHILNLSVVSFQFSDNHLLILPTIEN